MLTATLISLAIAAPLVFGQIQQVREETARLRTLAGQRADAISLNVTRALDQTITATAVLADSFDQGRPELLSRISSGVLRLIGPHAQLEIRPEGTKAILISANSAPPDQLLLPGLAQPGVWKAPVALGEPSVTLRHQQLSFTQALINRSPEGRTRFWGYITISQPFTSLATSAQLNQLAAEKLAIRVRYDPPGDTGDALLFDTFPDDAVASATKAIRLPGNTQLQVDIAPLAGAGGARAGWLYLLATSALLLALIHLILRHPARLQRQLEEINRLLESEKQALQREIGDRHEAETMLERSHRLLDSIFEHIPGMIVLKRASDRRIVRINRSGEQILSRSRHALIGRGNDEIFEPRLADRLNDSDEELLRERRPIQLASVRLSMPGQPPRWLSLRKTLLLNEGEQPEYILEFGQDVTEQEQLDLRLREHLHFLEQLLDAIPSPVFFKDTKGRYINVNQAFERYLGVDRSELAGKTVFDIGTPAMARVHNRADLELLASGGSQQYESPVTGLDGNWREVMVHKAVFHQTDGEMGGIVGILLDITERKRAEQQVSRLNRFLTVLSDANQAIVRLRSPDQLLAQIAELLCNSARFPLSWIAVDAADEPLLAKAAEDDRALLGELLPALAVGDGTAEASYQALAGRFAAPLGAALEARAMRHLALLPLKSGNRPPCGVIGILDGEGHSAQERQLLEDLANNVAQALEHIETERQKLATAEQLELAARVFENSAEGIVITDAGNRILMVNKAFTAVTGYAPDEVIGRNPSLLSSGRQDGTFYGEMWQALQSRGEWSGEIENRRKDGELYPEWLNISVVRQPDGSIGNYVAVFTDLTNRKEIEKRVLFLSHFDTLTALPNRQHFHDQLAHAAAQAASHDHRVALIALDIDRFNLFNENLGHAAGDRILVEAATRLKSCLAPGDSLCRLGGDEFAILLNNIENNEDAANVAVNIHSKLRKTMLLEGHEIHLSASIGISLFPDDATTADELISRADAAMYAAIEQGGNTFRFFQQEMNSRSAERMRIESRLHHALERGELSVFFQPLVRAQDGKIAGAEALLRWHHEELGAVSPGVFIPLLEDTKLIRSVGKWVLRKACVENKRWRALTGDDLFVAVNLSAVQLADDKLVDDIAALLAETAFDPRHLEIELTESAIMHDSELGIRTLNRLKDLGVRLSIDDFGTGYSSLSYLNQFPLDTLKIDRSFVMNAAADENAQAIIKAIVAMGHTLGFAIIAEGVEDAAQLKLLRENAVDILQGYYFSRPVPALEFEELLRRSPTYPLPENPPQAAGSRLVTLASRRR